MNRHLAFFIMATRATLIFGLLVCFLLVVSHDYVKTLKIIFLVYLLLFLLCTFHLSYLLFTEIILMFCFRVAFEAPFQNSIEN